MKIRNALLLCTIALFCSASIIYANDQSSASAMPIIERVNPKNAVRIDPNFKIQVQKARQEMQAQFQKERADFKVKLAALKDQRKQATMSAITERFTTINTNQTEKMTQSLTKLSQILDRLSSQSAEAKNAGKDMTTVDAVIGEAKQAIETSQAAVTIQAGKQYIPQITDETQVKQSATVTFMQLKNDLETTRKTVQATKEPVLTVSKAMKIISAKTK
jgi:hypothetical protein